MQPFRFGVNVWQAASATEWADKARRIEDLGFSTLTVPDHLGDFFAPIPAAVAAADATTRLRVGTMVLNNDFRHPVLVAREAATVDVLTGGRLQLGLAPVTSRLSTTRRGCASTPAASGSSGWPRPCTSSGGSSPGRR